MNARQAKKLAYSLAAGYLRGDVDAGCPYSSLKEQFPEMLEEDMNKISAALGEIIVMLEMRALDRRLL